MNSRFYEIDVAFETSTLPDPGIPSDPYDLITYGFLTSYAAKRRRITGTSAVPISVNNAASIAHGMTSADDSCLMYLKSSGGDLVPSGIDAGTADGQELTLVFTSDVDTLFISDSATVNAPNGSRRSLKNTVLKYHWDLLATKWIEASWNNVGNII